MMTLNKIKEFVLMNPKTIFFGFLGLFLLYWLVFIFTPKIEMSIESKVELNQIDEKIDGIVLEQNMLQNEIEMFQEELVNIDNNLGDIKESQDLNAQQHGKKITTVQSYNNDELVRFFTERYKN
jgi:hypothetical protein